MRHGDGVACAQPLLAVAAMAPCGHARRDTLAGTFFLSPQVLLRVCAHQEPRDCGARVATQGRRHQGKRAGLVMGPRIGGDAWQTAWLWLASEAAVYPVGRVLPPRVRARCWATTMRLPVLRDLRTLGWCARA